jgi:glucan phosphoethanolaminetransferase (alkaline phosphatase superfamily)
MITVPLITGPSRSRSIKISVIKIQGIPRGGMVFEEIGGLPLHPLVIHAAVVFVPLLAIGSVAYAVLPGLRRLLWWAVALLALAGAGSTILARFSGVAFRQRLLRKHLLTPEFTPKVDAHQHYGTVTMWVTIALAVVSLVLIWAVPRRRAAGAAGGGGASNRGGGAAIRVIFAVVVIGLAVASLYYVYRTGDSGARMVWGSF